jgi:hypothetical protein
VQQLQASWCGEAAVVRVGGIQCVRRFIEAPGMHECLKAPEIADQCGMIARTACLDALDVGDDRL